MAKADDEIANPRTGQRMVFLETGEETGGELLRIDSYNPRPVLPLSRSMSILFRRAVERSSPGRCASAWVVRSGRLSQGFDNPPGRYAPPLLERWGRGGPLGAVV